LEIPGSHIVGMVRQSEQLLTLTEAGERFGLSPVTLRVLVNQGRLAATKRGRDWFVTASAVRAYLKSRKPAGRPPSPEAE
jgi:excisionase family DNA binding protein